MLKFTSLTAVKTLPTSATEPAKSPPALKLTLPAKDVGAEPVWEMEPKLIVLLKFLLPAPLKARLRPSPVTVPVMS